MELSHSFFGHRTGILGLHAELPTEHPQPHGEKDEKSLLYSEDAKSRAILSSGVADSWSIRQLKTVLWFFVCMPLWNAIASAGKTCLTSHVTKIAMQTPHPIRIGTVRFARANFSSGDTRVVMLKPDQKSIDDCDMVTTSLLRADSLPKNHETHRTSAGRVVALPHLSTEKGSILKDIDTEHGDYESINQRIGAVARRQMEEDKFAIEDDPQQDPPSALDFMVAIFYVVFGVIAMTAGLLSIFL